MEHPICSQGDSDAHALLRAACAKLGPPQKRNGLRWSRKTLTGIQDELGWKKWSRVVNALQDLEDDTGGEVMAPDDKGVLAIPPGLECECETSVPSSVLDTASSRGKSRTAARGNPSPPSPPPSSAPRSEGGRSTPGLAGMRRIEEGSEASSDVEAPHVREMRRIVRRNPQARARARRVARRGKPIDDYNATDFAHYFRDEARRHFDTFEQHQNPLKPLAAFFAAARRGGPPGDADPEAAVDNDVIARVIDQWMASYRGNAPPWRMFLADAPEMLADERARTEQFGHGRARVDHIEMLRRYGSRLDDQTEHEDG